MSSSTPEQTSSATPITRSWILALVWVLPQGILAALNLSAFDLVRGDLSPEQGSRFLTLLFLHGALLLAGIGLQVFLVLRRRDVPWLWNLPILAVHIGYLWLSTVWIVNGLLPDSVTMWMLPIGRLLFYQYAFIMPVIFYSALRTASFPLRVHQGLDFGLTLLITLALPAGWYLLLHVVDVFWRGLSFSYTGHILMVMLVGSTVILCLGLLRLLTLGWALLKRAGEVGFITLCTLVGIVLPALGLLLNIKIPFPANFQAPAVYALTLLNGIALLWPRPEHPLPRHLLWFLRCFFFPFTLYFFLVFLPFLPLAIPAILAAGTGFLMLSPTMLFIVHGSRLLEGWVEIRTTRGLLPVLTAALAAFLIMPAVYTGRALMHRNVIHEALAYTYEADPGSEQRFQGHRGFLRTALHNLRDRREGVELPFLSHFYHAVVFKGLVLPDEKLKLLYQFYFGEELPESDVEMSILGPFTKQRGLMSSNTRMRGAPPPRNVKLSELEVETSRELDLEKTLVKISMHNQESVQAEFTTKLDVPEGVFISGFWLYIGDERVPGRLFEKKTALWVYRMIRDVTRRDPGLLVYESTRQVAFSVFPFEPNQVRRADIEFLYPRDMQSTLMIGDRSVELGGQVETEPAHAVFREGEGTYVRISGSSKQGQPSFSRSPFFHLVVDQSASSTLTAADHRRLLQELHESVPDVERVQVTFANFDSEQAYDTPAPIEKVLKAFPKAGLSKRGGFCVDRAVAGILARHASQTDEAVFTTYPLMVVLQSPETKPVKEADLLQSRHRVPEAGQTLLLIPDEAPQWENGQAGQQVVPVFAVRAGSEVRIAALGEPGADIALPMPGAGDPDAVLEIYQADQQHFIPLPARRMKAESRYGEGAGAWLEQEKLDRRQGAPLEARRSLVLASRRTGILVPATSYIVVENNAQWEMLERKEKQKLSETEALEFMQTPEPSTLLLLLLGGGALWMKKRTR